MLAAFMQNSLALPGPLAADVAGEVVDGKFVATKLETMGFTYKLIPLHIHKVNGTGD